MNRATSDVDKAMRRDFWRKLQKADAEAIRYRKALEDIYSSVQNEESYDFADYVEDRCKEALGAR